MEKRVETTCVHIVGRGRSIGRQCRVSRSEQSREFEDAEREGDRTGRRALGKCGKMGTR